MLRASLPWAARPLAPIGAACLATLSCNRHPLEVGEAFGGETAVQEISLSVPPVDLLFVIDTSQSMREEQDRLARQFPVLMHELGRIEGGFPDAHVGVVSTDLGSGEHGITTCETPEGDRGELQFSPRGACAGPMDSRFLDVVNDAGELGANVPDVARAVPGPSGAAAGCEAGADGAIDTCDIAEAFSCIARLGTGGCGYEQPLQAARLALSPPLTMADRANAGFLREGSLLGVVFITDEDDCSAANPDLFDAALEPLGPHNTRCFAHGALCDGIAPAGTGCFAECRPIDDGDGQDHELPWLHPPSDYVDFFTGLRADRGESVVLAAIAGPFVPGDRVCVDGGAGAHVRPSCQGSDGDAAAPPLRLRAVIDALGEDGVFGDDHGASICSDDFAPALRRIGQVLRERLPRPGCLPAPPSDRLGRAIERSDDAECAVSEILRRGTAEESRRTVPACRFAGGGTDKACPGRALSPGAVDNAPCWYFCDSTAYRDDGDDATAACDPYPRAGADTPLWQLRLCLDGACDPRARPPSGTWARLECLTCEAALGCEL